MLGPMNPLVKIRSVAGASSSGSHSGASLAVCPLQWPVPHEPACCFMTLGLGLSAVAFLKPRADSPSLGRSLELLAAGDVDLPAELCAVLLGLGSQTSPQALAAADDLSLLNRLGNARLVQTEPGCLQRARRLLLDWAVDCPPVYSVLGSILSQEAVNFVKDPNLIASGWLVFDGLAGTASIIEVPAKNNITVN